MKSLYLILILTLANLIFASACKSLNNTSAPAASGNSTSSGKSFPARSSERDTRRQIEVLRMDKDRNLRQAVDSPIPEEERANFKGLKYFPIDLGYHYEVQLKRYDGKERVKMLTTTGEQSEYIRYGYIEFNVGSIPCKLDVFKPAFPVPDDNHLFVPFRDATSGKESYGAGRYLDLQEQGGGRYVLDFNIAYNPYCAYNRRYSCPIPPAQNTLKAEIRAGEKNYHQ
jgi:uncharacterized protein